MDGPRAVRLTDRHTDDQGETIIMTELFWKEMVIDLPMGQNDVRFN